MFGGNFPIRSYAFCNGQLLSIAQNTALFSILGTTYGGNGQTTFGLPNLQSRVPIHFGQGQGLPSYSLGEMGGAPTHSLIQTEMPQHTHTNTSTMNASTAKATLPTPVAGSALGKSVDGGATSTPQIYTAAGSTTTVPLAGLNVAGTIGVAGGSQPHNNMQPYLALNFQIALEGIFPSRN